MNILRREFLYAPAALAQASKLNVLFIAIDDLNTDAGCYGAPVKTPSIDRLASQGVRFDRAYCQYPLCNPSRTSLLSGRRPPRTTVMENTTWFRDAMPDVVTLPEHFRRNGYRTLATGKIFHGGLDDDRAWDVGGTPLRRAAPRNPAEQKKRVQHADRFQALEGEGESEPDVRNATRAIQMLREKHDKPFFMAVGFAKPHVPFLAPRKYFDLYDPASIQLPPDFAPEPVGRTPAYRPNFDIFIQRPASPDEARRMIAGYRAATSFMDAQIGRVLAALEETGRRRDTVVVLFGDHGFHLGDKGMWSKQTLFEKSARVPLVVSVPGMAAGKPCGRTVELLDIYPTLADLCGLPAPRAIDGESFAPLLRDPARRWDHPAYTFLRRGKVMGASVRTERYRYTEWDGGAAGSELYDHASDPGESRNLASDAAAKAVTAQHQRLLRQAAALSK
ncbi:MAG: sulfatase [Bryobacteraceae bacterium]|nr:sulfatase [Bryobacteraceae bacterium]